MSVLEIGPDTVRVIAGVGGPVDHSLAEAALRWIDDPVGLHDGRPVPVAELWRAVMTAALADSADRSVMLVHPDDWPPRRVHRVLAAANAVSDEVVAVPLGRWAPVPDGNTDHEAAPGPLEPRRRFRAVRLVLAAGVVLAAGAALAVRPSGPQTVVEGRIAVQVPADWTVTRVTGGPGSRRLQAAPPADPDLALHITQSYAPESTLAHAAGMLDRVIDDQPPGVFVDFHAGAVVVGRPAATYREIRPGRVVDWSVVLVGSTLIGIGCQSPPTRTDAVRPACEQAVASAGESGTDPRP